MKKVLSLILAIVMIAMLVPAVVATAENATETTETTDTVETTVSSAKDGSEGDIATVTKKYFAVSFTMKAAKNAGVPADNGCSGLMFGNNDDTCIFIPYDGGNTDTQRTIGIDGHANVVCGKWWGTSPFGAQERTNIDEYVDKYVTILALGTMNEDGTATISAYVNGKQIKVWGGKTEATGEFNGKIKWAIRLNNVSADVKFMQSDSPMLVIAPEGASTIACSDEKLTVPVNVLQNPGTAALPIYPSADGFNFTGIEEDEEGEFVGEVFKNAEVGEVGTGVFYDDGLSKDSKKTGKLSNFTFDATRSLFGDVKVDLAVIEDQPPYNVSEAVVPTFTVPAHVTVTHGEGKEVVSEAALVSDATCTKKAVYHKSCECGALLDETFETGELKAHDWTNKVAEEYQKTPASCNAKAVYYKSCSVCGTKGEDTFEDGEPTGEHNFVLKHDADKHWYECACGEKKDEAAHEYDNACDTDCNVCGEVRTVEHNYSDEWKKDDNKHWHECACGAKKDEADHDFGEGVVTTEPTTEAEGEKTFTCACGQTKTEKIDKLPTEEVEPPKTGSTTALIAVAAVLSVTAGAAAVITRKKKED